MVKIIKAETQKWGGVEVEQKDGPCTIRKKRGKKCKVAKFVCLKGGRSVGGMVVFGCRGLQLRSRLEEQDGKLPSMLLQGC